MINRILNLKFRKIVYICVLFNLSDKMSRFLYIVLAFTLFSHTIFSRGLLFHANFEPIAERSSLNLFARNPETFDDFLDISCYFSLYDTESFGYLLFVNDQNSKSSYSVSLSPEADIVNLKLNITGKKSLLNIPIKKEHLGIKNWQKLRLVFDHHKNQIILQLNNDSFILNLKSHLLYEPEIVFGKYKSYIDIPKFAIRDISVKGKNKTINFRLDQKDGNIVTDTRGKKYGFAENPIWMINDSYKWTLRCEKRFKNPGVINFDEQKQLFYILDKDSLFSYDLKSNTITFQQYANACPADIRLGNSFINPETRQLQVYEVNNLPVNTPSMSALDLTEFNWETLSTDQLPWQLHHHSSFFNKKTGRYTLFGGFGLQRYYNHFVSFDDSTKKWVVEPFSGDRIDPRLFSGIAPVDSSKALLFGGIGNESGDITVGKEYFYDCYLIDFDKRESTFLWKINLSEKGLVTVRNMLLAEDKQSFYTICYPEYETHTYLKLYQFSIKDGLRTILGDSIPYMSDKIECNANLYYNSLTQEIYCTTQEFYADGENIIRIYSISSPPLANNNEALINSVFTSWILYALVGLLLVMSAIWIHTKRKKGGANSGSADFTIDTEYKGDLIKANSIYTFGEFTVYDKKGINISHLFNPKIKYLFLYLFIKGIFNGKGADSHEIQLAVWPEKTAENAKNLKGVALNQIRKIIADIDGIELQLINGYYKILINEPLYIDFIRFTDLISVKNKITETTLHDAVVISSRGPFLKEITNIELIGLTKNTCFPLLELLNSQLNQFYKDKKYPDAIITASIIRSLDQENCQAMNYMIGSFIRLNLRDQARAYYIECYNSQGTEIKQSWPVDFNEYLTQLKQQKII